MSMECPEGSKEWGSRPTIKIESVEQPAIVESDQEFSPYKPVPTIRIPVKIAEARAPTLIDTGASVNTISPRAAGRTNLPHLPVCPPVRVGQAFHPTGVLIKEKINSKISIPSKNWTSEEATDLLVTPLANSEAVLGMPFLAQERIKVDPATHDMLLPTRPKTRIAAPSGLRYTSSSRRRPAQCNPRLITPQEKRDPVCLELVTPPEPTLRPVDARRYHEEAIKEFPDLFADKLPPRSQ